MPSADELFKRVLEEYFDVYPFRTKKSTFLIISVLRPGCYDALYVDTSSHDVRALTLVSKSELRSFLESRRLLVGNVVVAVIRAGPGGAMQVERYYEKTAPLKYELLELIDVL
jgi:hypothetical protein